MEKPPFQFGLKAVFIVTTGAALLMAFFHYLPVSALGRLLVAVATVLCFSGSLFLVFVVWVRFCLLIIERRHPPAP